MQRKPSKGYWISSDGKHQTWVKPKPHVQSNHYACCGVSLASCVTSGRTLSSCSRRADVQNAVQARTAAPCPALPRSLEQACAYGHPACGAGATIVNAFANPCEVAFEFLGAPQFRQTQIVFPFG